MNMKDFKKILQNAKLKNTAPRMLVLKKLSDLKQPLTIQDLHKKIGKNKIDLVTLYRIITLFEKNQLVRRVDLRKEAIYYEFNHGHHHHLVCTDCGVVEDFKMCDMNSLTKKIISQASNFKKIKEHSL